MENAVALAHVMGPVYVVFGLSILLYVKPWQKLMEKWQGDHLLLFPFMFLYTVLGLISINMYNVWEWNVWLIVTVTGWCLFVKGVAYFLLPGGVLKKLLGMKNSEGWFYFGALAALVIGVALSYYSYFA